MTNLHNKYCEHESLPLLEDFIIMSINYAPATERHQEINAIVVTRPSPAILPTKVYKGIEMNCLNMQLGTFTITNTFLALASNWKL